MKVNVSCELSGQDVINEFFGPEIKKNGVDPANGKVTVSVQNKAGEFVEVAAEKVKFVFSNK